MEIDGHLYMHAVDRIEIEKVTGQYSQFVRVKIRSVGKDGTDPIALSFACWASTTDVTAAAPEVIITDKDEREQADALDAHNEESDR